MTDPRLPVTLLTGFLGAGKTTLLNALLTEVHGEGLAVVVNEFGEVGLDHDLIAESREDVLLMQSGCLCCSIRGDLSQSIAGLIARRDAGELAFDRIVIETTGLADPGPIMHMLLVDRYLARNTRLDGIVTLVDAVNGQATLDQQFEAISQVAMADLLVLSKADLATPTEIVRLEERLRGIAPGTRIIHAVKGRGVAARFRGLSALRETARPQDVLSWTGGPAGSGAGVAPDPLANLSGFAPGWQEHAKTALGHNRHDTRIGSASIVIDTPLDDKVFDRWLDTLIALRGPDILRVKGIVFLEGLENPFVFHGVQHIFDPPVQLRNWPEGDRRTRIVVIARDLSRPELQRSLDMLRATAPTSSPNFENESIR